LPAPGENAWNTAEYAYTTGRLFEAFRDIATDDAPMPLEKDFSPTLAGSDFATAQAGILHWLHAVPNLIRDGLAAASASRDEVRVGLKLFNALFEDEFQLEMLRAIH